ncbi:hypothetical protein OFR22_06675 [Brachyspira hyodysenteriae]|uniref:Uncharacterized protein n=2 Tax=Brachyspira hyodysenteriae TaxID=159 RepID=A0A3B6V9H5_BRAHW|nr:hypothetical protein [Brachyspira hyodysenteriae]ACN84005.1 hypothetical protein BHWA1_01535 [Brachyspira hyodysenteriae WA1]ANN63887.1 hypothetical protein BHYOB78_08410 [Brachyspira hyodysenteriae ATCC 27164]AUJ49733.1 hypothetical protein BH718_01292 [Brachyspira hyodysenteriae]KLI16277.1 hypothetical protein SU45_07715 [Brachyspira hyodysenteriae]KLI18035.1 hypothetical protein SU46_08270 [Brachyspira hyodysenteriae]
MYIINRIIIAMIFISSSILYSQYYSIGKWHLVEKIDPITDEKEISIFIKKQEQNSLNFNTLMIKVNSNSININLYTPSLLFKQRINDNDKIDLIYRLGKNEPRNTSLNKYGESEFYSLTNSQIASQKSLTLLKELLYNSTLAVRALETIGSAKYTYTYVYDLEELKDILLYADFSGTILENYKAEFESILENQRSTDESSQDSETSENSETSETSEDTETPKTNHKDNIYLIDDINYEKPII